MAVLYLEDENLIARLKENDDSAFESLLDFYGDRLLKVCYLILKNLPCAEDAVQETFIQIYKSIKRFKEDASLYTWIYKIAVNKCRDIMKKRKEYSSFDDDFEMDSGVNIEDEIIYIDSRNKIMEIVFSLKPVYREVITLFYFEDLTIKEICSILNEGENTVKSKLHRGRIIMKENLMKEGMVYGEGQI